MWGWGVREWGGWRGAEFNAKTGGGFNGLNKEDVQQHANNP